jgi:hypothetical protein
METNLPKVTIKKSCKQQCFSIPLYDSPAMANELHGTIILLTGSFCID